jgi:L-alanine-DL-glutamate epimerase-like enolase superfamily enzyme
VKIKDIRASVLRFPVTAPLIERPIDTYEIVFCEVETDEGHLGYGLTGRFFPRAVVSALHHDFLPLVRDMDPFHLEAIHHKAWWALNPRSMTGVFSSALSCLDIALWDIQGKAKGQSIAELLGGFRDHAPSYITFGFPEYDRDQLVEAARRLLEQGHRRLKMVVGVNPRGWQEDAARVRRLRDAVGDDVELMIDANYRFPPVEARLLCRAIEDCRLTWFEEPLHQNDARQLADLRRHTSIPIAAGQMEGHRWRLRELIERQAVDIVQPNCVFNGGYTETRKVAHMAQAFNLPIANGGGWPRFNMHTMAGLMNGWRVEFHLGMAQVEDRIFKDPPWPENNIVKIPRAPGLGLELNREAVEEARVRD